MMDRSKSFYRWGLLAALVMAGLLAPFASSGPDGFETVAERYFPERLEAEGVWRFAPGEDYLFPGVENPYLATALAGFLGTLLLFGFGWGMARLLASRAAQSEGRHWGQKS